MEDITENLRKYFISKGLTQKDVAEALGIAEQTVNGLLNGRRKFGKKTAIAWQNKFGLSAAWLLTGNGEMFLNGSKTYEITIGDGTRVINAGGNVTGSQNDGAEFDQLKQENKYLKQRIAELEKDKEFLQNLLSASR